MKARVRSLSFAFIVSIVAASPVLATPVLYNGHAYEYIQVPNPFPGNTWSAAEAASEASIFNGANGHLATITSQGENDFLLALALAAGRHTDFAGSWLGGNFTKWLVGPEAGQSLTYANWGGIEPNNSGYAYMNIGVHPAIGTGTWADDSAVQGEPDGADPVIGYFVEYEGFSSVPETVPGWLFPLTAGGLFLLRKRISFRRSLT